MTYSPWIRWRGTSADELCGLSAFQLSKLLTARTVSPVEIVESYLRRIENENDKVRAYIYVSFDRAIDDARTAESEIVSEGTWRGPLHGIPVAYKDVFDVAELPTTAASRLLQHNIARVDSAVASQLRASGLICLGKLNMFELASGDTDLFGAVRNPWSTDCITGGSSSGSAAALAADLTPLATGTDTGGSIRDPAALCGVVGLKPTVGLVNKSGIVPLSWSLDHAGPMARTVRDAAMLLEAMVSKNNAGFDHTLGENANYLEHSTKAAKAFRVGIPTSFYFDGLELGISRSMQRVLTCFKRLTRSVSEVSLDHAWLGPAASWVLAYTEAFALHHRGFQNQTLLYSRKFIAKISSAAFVTGSELAAAIRLKEQITFEFFRALRLVDFIVVPTVGDSAYPLDRAGSWTDIGRRNMGSLTRTISLTGLPAITVPCGFTDAGLPIGVQIIGRAWEERFLLQLACAYEDSRGWDLPPPASSCNNSDPSRGNAEPSLDTTAGQVLDSAHKRGMAFIDEELARDVARIIDPVKQVLGAVR